MLQNATELIDALRLLPDETEHLEFKTNFSEPEKEGRDICALSNSAAYHSVQSAYKIWGIRDETHEAVGTIFRPKAKKKGNQELEIWLRQHLSPNVNFEFFEVEYQGLPVVVLRIWPAVGYPAEFDNIPYIRTGSCTQKLASGSMREAMLWRRIQQDSFETQDAVDELTIDEVLGLLDANRYFDLLGIPRPDSPETTLHYFRQDGLARLQDNGRLAITNLGALLFANELSDFPSVKRKSLRVIRYEGKGRAGQRHEREFARGYALDLEDAYLYLQGLTAVMEDIEGAKRTGRDAYPELSLRELIVNALIHQDLTITGAGPMVEVFDNRIEITNPGAPLIDTERLVNDPPRSRNEKLSAIMRRFGFCEEAGSGWDKVIAGCELYHLPAPRIETRESMRVTLFQARPFNALTPDERLWACYWHACSRYEEGEYATNASLRERFDVKSSNAAQISRLIKEAVESNLIAPVDPSTSPRYMKYKPHWA